MAHPLDLKTGQFRLVLIVLIFFGVSCDDTAGDESLGPSDDSTLVHDSGLDTVEVNLGSKDTVISVPSIPQPPQVGRSGVLGYSHPESIKRNGIGYVEAIIDVVDRENSLRDVQGKVIDTLNDINKLRNAFRGKTEIKSFTDTNLLLFSHITVELIDPTDIFDIRNIHDSSYQKIDTFYGNRWTWSITTNSEQAKGELVLKVVAHNPGAASTPFTEKYIPISIEIDNSGFFRSIWIFLQDNLELTLTAILIPIAAYLINQLMNWLRRRKQNKTTDRGPY